MFAPLLYQVTAPVVLQPVMQGVMPSLSQASGLSRAMMLANGRLAGNSMAQGLVTTPTAGQQM